MRPIATFISPVHSVETPLISDNCAWWQRHVLFCDCPHHIDTLTQTAVVTMDKLKARGNSHQENNK